MSEQSNRPKRMLIVEEEDPVRVPLVREFGRYEGSIELRDTGTVDEAIEILMTDWADILILDLWMPFDSNSDKVALLGDKEREVERTVIGLEVLEWLRTQRGSYGAQLPVAVITARNWPSVINKVNSLVSGDIGGLFIKPYKPSLLEFRACEWLGIPCSLPEDMQDEARTELEGRRGV